MADTTTYIPDINSYNARNCIVTITNADMESWTVTGFGESMISIEKEEALAENVVGAKGDIVRSVINNGIYNVTLTLQSVSPSFSKLWALKDDEFFGITIQLPIGTNATFSGSKAGILELPALSYGTSAEDVEFTICVYDGAYTIG